MDKLSHLVKKPTVTSQKPVLIKLQPNTNAAPITIKKKINKAYDIAKLMAGIDDKYRRRHDDRIRKEKPTHKEPGITAEQEMDVAVDAAEQEMGVAVDVAEQEMDVAVDAAEQEMGVAVDVAEQEMDVAVDAVEQEIDTAVNVAEQEMGAAVDAAEQEMGDAKQEMDVVDDEIEEQYVKDLAGKKDKKKTRRANNKPDVFFSEELVQFGDTQLLSRLPKEKKKVNISVPSYYMNNREKFINFINKLFLPYKQEIMDASTNVTCDSIGNAAMTGAELFTHQKIIKDYMNLYTPYRGLLLYHGLGSGKTCGSIAISEGMKTKNPIIVMVPASLRRNYMEDLKKCGDLLFKRNQYWEWISVKGSNSKLIPTLASLLSIQSKYIKTKKGAWMMDVTKETNYATLNEADKKTLDLQLDEMIKTKYSFVHYNGLRRDTYRTMTQNNTINPFDNSTVIIDEAHNMISRIVNKINQMSDSSKIKKITASSHVPMIIRLYHDLQRAENVRVVLLSGTPIVNYPNEISVLFNILRGYIVTWDLKINVKTTQSVTTASIQNIIKPINTTDYVSYRNNVLTITRNPYGFVNNYENNKYTGVSTSAHDVGSIEYIKSIKKILENNGLEVVSNINDISYYSALPDNLLVFTNTFIQSEIGPDGQKKITLKNPEKFKKRIMGMVSYFRSAQENLLPVSDISRLHITHVPMSNYQFKIYEALREGERESEKKKKTQPLNIEGLYVPVTSSYRVFSRLACNYVMPVGYARPAPEKQEKDEPDDISINTTDDMLLRTQEELEGDEILMKSDSYKKQINNILREIYLNKDTLLTSTQLSDCSPKFQAILENITNVKNVGLHLLYSQFRSFEGIELFSYVLDANGFSRLRFIKNNNGDLELDINEQNKHRPKYALYTGTENAQEREYIRNIYNGDWGLLPKNMLRQLESISPNNRMGEIVKLLMITSAGSEGINLKNTRFVHIMDPYWHPVRTEQVIGRARRICSHQYLPNELQTVDVFVYLMTFTDKQLVSPTFGLQLDRSMLNPSKVITTDEYLHEISSMKQHINSQILKTIKEASIDCSIYSEANSKEGLKCITFNNPNNTDFAYTPNIDTDVSDIDANLNKRKLTWKGQRVTVNGVQYVLNRENMQIYDYESYMAAQENPNEQPTLIGVLQKQHGKYIIT